MQEEKMDAVFVKDSRETLEKDYVNTLCLVMQDDSFRLLSPQTQKRIIDECKRLKPNSAILKKKIKPIKFWS